LNPVCTLPGYLIAIILLVMPGPLHAVEATMGSSTSPTPVSGQESQAVLTELTRIATMLQEAIRTGDKETFGRHSTEGLTLVSRDGKTYDQGATQIRWLPENQYETSG
jgi:hypothetical protein